jgi:hypothetical protein
LKNPIIKKRAGGVAVAQGLEHLSSKYEALSSNSSAAEKKKAKENQKISC